MRANAEEDQRPANSARPGDYKLVIKNNDLLKAESQLDLGKNIIHIENLLRLPKEKTGGPYRNTLRQFYFTNQAITHWVQLEITLNFGKKA